MAETSYRYIIVGAGLAGGWAVNGIRELDPDGSILLLGAEPFLPYDRPPLSKGLWLGKKRVEQIFAHDEVYYRSAGVDLMLNAFVTGVDPAKREVVEAHGQRYGYEKLLLATGGQPRHLDVPGGDLPGIHYYRTLADYLRLRPAAQGERTAVVVGSGFIGSEMAAALHSNGVRVTMVYPEPYLVRRVFPEDLGRALQESYRQRGVTIYAEDLPTGFERRKEGFVTHTRAGRRIESDLVVVGAGMTPALELAQGAGLNAGNGILVDEHLRTSDANIYAAGDNANFPYQALGQRMRIEHWDNAVSQGKHAGRNLAGANEPFTYMPYFYSDLFEFGYEAVGEVNTALESFADWVKEYDTGVIYYLHDGHVRGAMMCNTWEKLDAARDLIRSGRRVTPQELRGAIR